MLWQDAGLIAQRYAGRVDVGMRIFSIFGHYGLTLCHA